MQKEICNEDVLNVASSLKKTLDDNQVQFILENYNPSNDDLWFEEIENLIYQL